VDDAKYYDVGVGAGGGLLVVQGGLLEGFVPPPEVLNAPYDGGVDFHIAADAFQRERLMHALSIAMLLNRSVEGSVKTQGTFSENAGNVR
jgi:hypothetical protein